MMRRLAVILPLALLSIPAMAQQQSDPAQAFAKEWGTLQAADTLAASSHEHVAELANKLIGEYQKQQAALKQSAADLAAAEAQKATLIEWLKAAQHP